RALKKRLETLFPAFADAALTHSWRGFIAATTRFTPAIGELPNDPSVSYPFGCHGNGVPFMTWPGPALAKPIPGTAGRLPAPLCGLPDAFPLPAWRPWLLRAMLARAWADDTFR